MGGQRRVDLAGAAHLVLADGVRHLQPEEAVFGAMLAGWETQQRSRRLAAATIESRLRLVRRFAEFAEFAEFANEYPWQWTPADLEEWSSSLISAPESVAFSTVRTYQQAVAMFCDYLVDGRCGWAPVCEERFGTYAVQICHEWNTVAYTTEFEGRPQNRPLTREELQALFDHADEQVAKVVGLGRKGWLAAFRDAALLTVIYAWGLRRQEAARLDVCDFRALRTALDRAFNPGEGSR